MKPRSPWKSCELGCGRHVVRVFQLAGPFAATTRAVLWWYLVLVVYKPTATALRARELLNWALAGQYTNATCTASGKNESDNVF